MEWKTEFIGPSDVKLCGLEQWHLVIRLVVASQVVYSQAQLECTIHRRCVAPGIRREGGLTHLSVAPRD